MSVTDHPRLRLLPPHTAVAAASALFTGLYVCSPYRYLSSTYSWHAYLSLFANLALLFTCPCIYFLLGLTRQRPGDQESALRALASPSLALCLNGALVLAAAGGALRLYDLAVNRSEVTFNAGDADSRYKANREAESTKIGMVSALLYPLSLPLILILVTQHALGIPVPSYRLKLGVLILVAAVPIGFATLLGKRGSTLVTCALLLLFRTYYGRKVFSVSGAFTSLIVLLALGVFSVYFMELRLKSRRSDLSESVERSGYADLLRPTPFLRDVIADRFFPARKFILSYANLSAYFTAGLPEYLYLVDNHDSREKLYGYVTFNTAYKVIEVAGLHYFQLGGYEQYFPRPYIYSTLFGPLFIDFGDWNLVVSFLLGGIAVWIFSVARRNPFFVPLYMHMYLVMLFAPTVNLIYMFFSAYNLIVYSAFAIALTALVYVPTSE